MVTNISLSLEEPLLFSHDTTRLRGWEALTTFPRGEPPIHLLCRLRRTARTGCVVLGSLKVPTTPPLRQSYFLSPLVCHAFQTFQVQVVTNIFYTSYNQL